MIGVRGYGTVCPAGWGVAPFREALAAGTPIPTRELQRPGSGGSLLVRSTPSPSTRPEFMAHPRLRRTSPISQYAVAAALEAIGQELPEIRSGTLRLGIVFCVMCGCVNYSRRFYDEVLKDPRTASPLLFPETVFNAPASHLSALLGTASPCYTLMGDQGTFLEGLALAAHWLQTGATDRCLVVSAEEIDWLIAAALKLFVPLVIMADGAGAVYLSATTEPGTRLSLVTDAHLFTRKTPRLVAARNARGQIGPGAPQELLCDGLIGVPRLDAAETAAWRDWPGTRVSPKRLFGEGFTAAAAWQTIAALDALASGRHQTAVVSVVGSNEEAIAATFTNASETAPEVAP